MKASSKVAYTAKLASSCQSTEFEVKDVLPSYRT